MKSLMFQNHLKVSSRIITDFHPLNYSLNIPEVIVHSSNIGSAKIAEKFGPNIQLKYLKSLGLTNILSIRNTGTRKTSSTYG